MPMRKSGFLAVLFALLPPSALLPAGCVPSVPLDDANCPCLDNYYCAEGNVCKSHADDIAGSIGKSYVIHIGTEQWTEPPGFAESVEENGEDGVAPVFAFTIQAADLSSKTFSVLLGTWRDGVQDPCNRTYLMSGTFDPRGDDGIAFQLGPKDIQSIIFGPTINTLATFYGFTLSGRFVDRAQGVDGGALQFVGKASEIYNLFYLAPSTSGQELCDLFAAYAQYPCQACPSEQDAPLCLPFEAVNFSFSVVPGLALRGVGDFNAECI